MTYYEHYFRLFRAIDALPKCPVRRRWRQADKAFHLEHVFVIAVCLAQGYVETRGELDERIRVTRKGRRLS